MVLADPDRVIETIARRADLIAAVDEGPRRKQDLVEALPVSRSTVDRAVRELENAGLLRRDQGRVRLTLEGELAYAEYERFREGLDGIREAWPILDPIGPNTELVLDVFRRAEFVRAQRHAPHRPIEALKAFLTGSDRIRGVASAVLPDYVDVYSRQILQQGTEVDLVVSRPVLETLLAEYRSDLEAALDTGRLRLRESVASPPFSTIVANSREPEVGVVVYGDSGATGFVRNDSREAVAWATEWISSWEDGADLIGTPDDVVG